MYLLAYLVFIVVVFQNYYFFSIVEHNEQPGIVTVPTHDPIKINMRTISYSPFSSVFCLSPNATRMREGGCPCSFSTANLIVGQTGILFMWGVKLDYFLFRLNLEHMVLKHNFFPPRLCAVRRQELISCLLLPL